MGQDNGICQNEYVLKFRRLLIKQGLEPCSFCLENFKKRFYFKNYNYIFVKNLSDCDNLKIPEDWQMTKHNKNRKFIIVTNKSVKK